MKLFAIGAGMTAPVRIIGASIALALVSAPVVAAFDASNPAYVPRPKAKPKPKRRAAAKPVVQRPAPVRAAPAVVQAPPAPVPAYTPPAYVPPAPVVAAPPAPTYVPPVAPPAAPVVAAKKGSIILPLLIAAGVVGGVVALAGGGDNGPASP